MFIRHAAAAGDYYPRDEESLGQTMDKISRRVRTQKKTVLGGLVPHSGIFYCGEAQANVYKSVSGSPLFVVIGANHRGDGEPYGIMTRGNWETPMGKVSIDVDLAEAILDNTEWLVDDYNTFSIEHSIETQLPWLQKYFRNLGFVPISIHGLDVQAFRDIGLGIREAAHQMGTSICVIASSDLTRYGEANDFVPMRGGPGRVLDWIRETDEKVLEEIGNLNPEGVIEASEPTNICGIGAILTMMYSVMEVASGGTTLHYDTSFPVTKSINSVTSFAGMIME